MVWANYKISIKPLYSISCFLMIFRIAPTKSSFLTIDTGFAHNYFYFLKAGKMNISVYALNPFAGSKMA